MVAGNPISAPTPNSTVPFRDECPIRREDARSIGASGVSVLSGPERTDAGASLRDERGLLRSSRTEAVIGRPPARADASFTAPPEIVQVTSEFSTAGGVETVAWELAHALARAGIRNRVITNRTVGRVAEGITVQTEIPWLSGIPTRGVLGYLGRSLVVPMFSIAATLALRRHRSAVVISHGDTLAGDVLVVHAVNAESLRQKRRERKWRWRLNPLHSWVALREHWMIGGLRYKTFVAVSRRVRCELQEHYAVPDEAIATIPNGIDLARFEFDPAAGRTVRAEFGIPASAKVLLFAGHEFSRKGLTPLMAALGPLGPDFRLLVVGSDNPAPYRSIAKEWVDRVIFAGARSDMPALYAAADAFVLPTQYETFSLVCMEAMACGVPVFATAVGGIEDYLVDGFNGHFIQPEADDIARVVARALASPEHVAVLCDGARETARRYTWDQIIRRYLDIVEHVAASKPGSASPMLGLDS